MVTPPSPPFFFKQQISFQRVKYKDILPNKHVKKENKERNVGRWGNTSAKSGYGEENSRKLADMKLVDDITLDCLQS